MYAVVKTGGKEYRVSKGGPHPDREAGRKRRGSGVLKDVLMVSEEGQAQFGTPLLTQAVVTGKIVEEAKGKRF